MSEGDLIWCDECGAGVSWKHARRRPSWRRRLVWSLTRALDIVALLVMRLHRRLIEWADRPERDKYERFMRPRWHATDR